MGVIAECETAVTLDFQLKTGGFLAHGAKMKSCNGATTQTLALGKMQNKQTNKESLSIHTCKQEENTKPEITQNQGVGITIKPRRCDATLQYTGPIYLPKRSPILKNSAWYSYQISYGVNRVCSDNPGTTSDSRAV